MHVEVDEYDDPDMATEERRLQEAVASFEVVLGKGTTAGIHIVHARLFKSVYPTIQIDFGCRHIDASKADQMFLGANADGKFIPLTDVYQKDGTFNPTIIAQVTQNLEAVLSAK